MSETKTKEQPIWDNSKWIEVDSDYDLDVSEKIEISRKNLNIPLSEQSKTHEIFSYFFSPDIFEKHKHILFNKFIQIKAIYKTRIYCYEDNIISGTWKDKRNENMINSFDSFKSATYINENGKLTTKTHVFFNYNQNMRGVDLLNQLCSYYWYFIDPF